MGARYAGPRVAGQPLCKLHTPKDGYLGALVAQEPAPHQPAVVLALCDSAQVMQALFVRPMIRVNSDYSKFGP